MHSGSAIIGRKIGLNHFVLLCARCEADSSNVSQKFHVFELGLASGGAIARPCGGIAAERGCSSRFLGVRMSNRKKTMVMNPNIPIRPGLKSRKKTRVARRQMTNPLESTTRATLV
jgi:hypothetical protein